jgi:hypothetical protein
MTDEQREKFFQLARPIAQKAHDATFPVRGCLRRLDLARDAYSPAGDFVPFVCPGCKAEHRVGGRSIAAAARQADAAG